MNEKPELHLVPESEHPPEHLVTDLGRSMSAMWEWILERRPDIPSDTNAVVLEMADAVDPEDGAKGCALLFLVKVDDAYTEVMVCYTFPPDDGPAPEDMV